MPSRHTSPPATDIISADRATLTALKDMPAYAPSDLALNTNSLIALEAALASAETDLARARLAYDLARSRLAETAWAFHDSAVGARIAVRAQFGPDSDALHAVGLTRASERKRPSRRVRTTSA